MNDIHRIAELGMSPCYNLPNVYTALHSVAKSPASWV